MKINFDLEALPVSLADALFGRDANRVGRVTVGVLATAIEKSGIYGWDDYGRKKGPDDDGINKRALGFLAAYYKETEKTAFSPDYDYEMGILDNDWGDLDSPLQSFFWPANELPDFDGLASGLETKPQALHGKRRTTYQRVIATLLHALSIDPNSHGAAAEIVRFSEHAGDALDRETATSVLRELVQRKKTRK
ncbi:MAG: hypothetical protein ABF296_10025 [Oceanococcaceae bacterium]